jgi:hypothetical protein
MGLFKEEMRELLRIKKVMSSIGYFACSVEKHLSYGDAMVHIVACEPGEHNAEIQADIQLLESLPDGVTRKDYAQLRAKRYAR